MKRRDSIFLRLLASHLLVVAVGAGGIFLAGEALSPLVIDRHVRQMVTFLHTHMDRPLAALSQDLEVSYRRALTQSIGWSVALAALAGVAVAWFVTRRIVKPLRSLTLASRRIAGGRYAQRLDAGAPGEIGELAAAFNRMAETLQHSEEQRVKLLSDVAHEFRTPLSNLRGYLEGLEDGVFGPKDVAEPTRRQIARLEHLVDDLSLLSRVETGQVPLVVEPVAAAEILEAAAEAFRPRFAARDVDLVVDPTEADLTVLADGERVQQVLGNLLANALRFSPARGRVRLGARWAGSQHLGRAHRPSVRFEVQDDGPGVAPGEREAIFRRFYRGDTSRGRDDGGGSGIGLTLAKELIERQDGEIGVDSTEGEGSSFWFVLPGAGTAPR